MDQGPKMQRIPTKALNCGEFVTLVFVRIVRSDVRCYSPSSSDNSASLVAFGAVGWRIGVHQSRGGLSD